MTAGGWISDAHGLLLNTIQRRAWGESVGIDSFDPSNLVDELRPAISDAIKAVDSRGTMASVMLDLYWRFGGSDSEALSMLFRASMWTGSSVLWAAIDDAVRQSGPGVIELLREALLAETEDEAAIELLFDACRVAANAITVPAARLAVLQKAYHQALDASDDPAVSESLREGLELATQQTGPCAAETLLDYYQHEAALGAADDPWPLLAGLIESLRTTQEVAPSDGTTMGVLKQTLREAVADDGIEELWEGYQYRNEYIERPRPGLCGRSLADGCRETPGILGLGQVSQGGRRRSEACLR